MKKPLLLCFFLIFGGKFLSAQPTLSSANNPQAGERYFYRITDTIAQPGDPGAGQTWNFTNVFVSLNTVILNYVLPSATPYAASYPSANLASYIISGDYEYYTTGASSFVYNGKGTVNDQAQITGSSYILFSYPFTFGTNVVNTVSGSTGAGTISGTVTVTGDGHGTLKLPGITYNNVLRVRREENITYSFGPGVDENILTVSYFWYSSQHDGPLMKFVTTTTSGIATGYTKFVGVADFGLGIDGPENPSISSIAVHPNPATSDVQLSFSSNQPSDILFRVMDITGRIWKEWNRFTVPGEVSIRLDVADLPRGIYLVSAYTEGTLRQDRLILE
ncbi:MAG TPA: T9SS type A sorting domain-containing protein [Bacteroidia bacterium]|nr:T9SS type A sorting domain-containing protein [Bacteroidia bacterium]